MIKILVLTEDSQRLQLAERDLRSLIPLDQCSVILATNMPMIVRQTHYSNVLKRQIALLLNPQGISLVTTSPP